MPKKEKPQILLTNDDGIRSPGLWAAAEALSSLGFVTVAAPREEQSGSGRGFPSTSDGVINQEQVEIDGKTWKVFAVGGSPAQVVQHAILELMPRKPDLVVAGINFGENIGSGVTISGTVGAALEAAAFGIHALAVSLETKYHLRHRRASEVDFSTAAYFTHYFGQKLLSSKRIVDVDVLKVEIPEAATPDTAWKATRISREKYFVAVRPKRERLEEPAALGFHRIEETDHFRPGTDAFAIRVEGVVSVTPLSLDLTSRVDLKEFENTLR